MKKISLIVASAIVLVAAVSCNNTPKKNAVKASENTECSECPKHTEDCEAAQGACCKEKANCEQAVQGACCKEKKNCDGQKACCKKAEGKCCKKAAAQEGVTKDCCE